MFLIHVLSTLAFARGLEHFRQAEAGLSGAAAVDQVAAIQLVALVARTGEDFGQGAVEKIILKIGEATASFAQAGRCVEQMSEPMDRARPQRRLSKRFKPGPGHPDAPT